MMAIPPRFLSELRDRLSLSDIVGKRVKLTRAGNREFKACCPFHSEKSPSFTLNDEKQFYHCFGCGAHGDVIGFVMQHDNVSFIEAVEMLAAQAGMQVPEQRPEEIEKSRQQKDLYALLDETSQWFEFCLRGAVGRTALDYMKGRGIDDETLGRFRIGFAPADGGALWTHLQKKGFSPAQAIEAGVVKPSNRGGAPFAFFRERVMFPVADRRGRVVAFGGRILPDHLRTPDRGDGKPPKYINSGESPLFHKGKMLYNETHARQAAAEGQPVLVVEGYLDVIRCHMGGFRGAVAPLGTALTEEQIVAMWKMIPGQVRQPVLCFDGDNAGRRAAARACERLLPLLAPDQTALMAFLPEGQDPDSLIRAHGADSFARVLAAALPLSDFIWNLHTEARRFETPESRAGLEKSLEADVLRIVDRSVQQYYRRAFQERLYRFFGAARKSPPASAGGTLRRPSGGKFAGQRAMPPRPAAAVRPAVAGHVRAAHVLLAGLINHPVLFDQVEEQAARLETGNERLDLLRQTILNTLGRSPTLDAAGLKSHLSAAGYGAELETILSEAVYTHAGFVRPGADPVLALAGWQDTFAFLKKKAYAGEIREAGLALARDFTRDNEEKIMALHDLHDVHKANET